MSKIKSWIFDQLHGNKLLYNTCWEDPRCDRKLLNIKQDSRIVMITSAGDNALEYLLDNPEEIHAVDVNYRQNALLELKRSVFKNANHEILFKYFGDGALPEYNDFYQKYLRDSLPEYVQKYWDKHIKYFKGRGLRKSFYYRGTSGLLAFLLRNYFAAKKKIKGNVEQLLESKTIQEQIIFYSMVEERIFNPMMRMVLNNHYTMSLAGVPDAQQSLIQGSYAGGNVEYIQQSLRSVFTKLKVSDNYFYQVYYRGYYTKDSCPEYLKSNNYSTLGKLEKRLKTHTNTLSGFLKENPGQYSHFILLDHQDWLAAHDVAALEEEWRLILANSRSGTRILLRSAATKIDFFPDFIQDKITFKEELMEAVHKEDRVGTYASVYLGVVK